MCQHFICGSLFVFCFLVFWVFLMYGFNVHSTLEGDRNTSRESSGKLQWPRQKIMDATLQQSSGGGDELKMMYLRGTCKAKSAGLHVGMDMGAKGK